MKALKNQEFNENVLCWVEQHANVLGIDVAYKLGKIKVSSFLSLEETASEILNNIDTNENIHKAAMLFYGGKVSDNNFLQEIKYYFEKMIFDFTVTEVLSKFLNINP